MEKYEQLSILDKYRHQNFLSINKSLISMFGLVKAGYMAYLMDKCHYFLYTNQTDDEWFYVKDKDLNDKLGLSRHVIKKCRKELIEIGIIETKTQNIPHTIIRTTFYKINFDVLKDIENEIYSKKYELESEKTSDDHAKNERDENFKLRSLKIETSEFKNLHSGDKNFKLVLYKLKQSKKTDKKNKKHVVGFQRTKKYITPNDFEKFWKSYPRKVQKPKAKEAWDNLCYDLKTSGEKITLEELNKAIETEKGSWNYVNEKYIPHASTWINQRRWEKALKISEYKIVCKRLMRVVHKVTGDNPGKSLENKWAYDIALLAEEYNLSKKEIIQVISEYQKIAGRKYVPKINSGEDLREKYKKLTDAIEREKHPQKKFSNRTGYSPDDKENDLYKEGMNIEDLITN